MHRPSVFTTIVLIMLLTGCASSSRVSPPVITPSRNTPAASPQPQGTAPAKAPEHPPTPQPSCQQAMGNVSTPLLGITRYWHRQRILYNSVPLSDCSGMFHRVVHAFQAQCPGYALPHPVRNRTSRQIAAWYARQGCFTIVTNPRKQASLI